MQFAMVQMLGAAQHFAYRPSRARGCCRLPQRMAHLGRGCALGAVPRAGMSGSARATCRCNIGEPGSRTGRCARAKRNFGGTYATRVVRKDVQVIWSNSYRRLCLSWRLHVSSRVCRLVICRPGLRSCAGGERAFVGGCHARPPRNPSAAWRPTAAALPGPPSGSVCVVCAAPAASTVQWQGAGAA